MKELHPQFMNFQTIRFKQKKSRAGRKKHEIEKSVGGMNRAIFLPGATCGYCKEYGVNAMKLRW